MIGIKIPQQEIFVRDAHVIQAGPIRVLLQDFPTRTGREMRAFLCPPNHLVRLIWWKDPVQRKTELRDLK